MFIVYILCKNRKIFYRGCFCAFLAGQRSHLLSFYCSNFWIFIFLFGADFFLPERKVFPAHFIQALFAHRFHKSPTAPPRKGPTQKPREPVAPLNAHLEIPTQKARRARRAFTSTRLYLACRRVQKAPVSARPQPLKTTLSGPCTANLALFTHTKGPNAKTPGVIPGVWLMKSSFNLLLTHCGRFLAGCTGPACSRRPQ